MTQYVQAQVKYKRGVSVRTVILTELQQLDDVVQLPSGHYVKLVGTDAHGVRVYEEIDPPKRAVLIPPPP